MIVDIPDELVELWPRLDTVYQLASDASRANDGISRASLAALFTTVTGPAPWKHPSFMLWATIRHHAGCYSDFQEQIAGFRTDEWASQARVRKDDVRLDDEAQEMFAERTGS